MKSILKVKKYGTKKIEKLERTLTDETALSVVKRTAKIAEKQALEGNSGPSEPITDFKNYQDSSETSLG